MKNMKRKVLSFVLLTTLGLTASLAMTSCGGDSSSSSSSTSSTSSSVQLPKMPTPVLSKINYGSMTYTWEDVNNDGGYIYELNGQQFEVSRPEKIPLKPGDTLKVKVKSGLPTLYQDSDWSEPIIVPIKYINVTFEYEVGDKEPHTEQYLCFSEEEFPTPEIPGYTFSHWYMKGESINHKYTGVPNTWEEDATLVGAFIPNDYKITYGNYDVKVTYTTGDSTLDAKYNLPKDITLNNERQTYGYVEPYLYELESRNKVFAGWYADEELTIPFDFEQFITQDTTIYAKILDYEKLYYAHDEGKVYMISNDRNEYSKYYTAYVGPSSYLIDPDSYTFVANVNGTIKLHYQKSDAYNERSVDMEIYNETTKNKLASTTVSNYVWKEIEMEVKKGDLITINLDSNSGASGNQKVIMYITGNDVSANMKGAPNFIDVAFGADFVIPYYEEKEGMRFVGYYTEANGMGTKITDEEGNSLNGYNFVGNVTLYPHYEVEEYVITYNSFDGVLEENQYYDEVYTAFDEDVILPTFKKEGHTFIGWYDNPNFEGDIITKIEKGSTGNKELYAKFELLTLNVDAYISEVTVNFETFGGETVAPITINKDNQTLYPPITKKEGYIFAGWYLDQNFTSIYDFTYPLLKDTTLYAKFVSVNNGLYNNVKTDVEYDYIDNIVYDFTVPSGEGVTYRFTFSTKEVYGYSYSLKMYEESNANIEFEIYNETTKQYLLQKTSIESFGNQEFRFTTNQYDVISVYCYGKDSDKAINIAIRGDESYNVRGIDYLEEKQIEYGSAYSILAREYKGLVFKGYYTEPNGQGTLLIDENGNSVSNWNIEEDTKIYAYYEPIRYTVSYDLHGGYSDGVTLPESYTIYDVYELPEIEGPGKIFKYWYEEVDGQHNIITSISYALEKDIVLHACFEAAKYEVTVIYDVDSNLNETFEVTYGDPFALNIYEVEGYNLISFTLENGNNVASPTTGNSYGNYFYEEDITVYATYELINYGIYYYYNGGEAPSDYVPLDSYTIATDHELPILVKDYYEFLGWYSNDTLIENLRGNTGTLYLNAKFKAVEFDVTVVMEGYNLDLTHDVSYRHFQVTLPDTYQKVTSTSGIKYFEPEEVEGYIFIGWEKYTDYYDFTLKVDSDLYLSSKWLQVNADSTFSVYRSQDITITNSIRLAFVSYFDEKVKIESSTTNDGLIYKIYSYDGTLLKETTNKEELVIEANEHEVYYLEIMNLGSEDVETTISLQASKVQDGGTALKLDDTFVTSVPYDGGVYIDYMTYTYAQFKGYYTEPNGQGKLIATSTGYVVEFITDDITVYPYYEARKTYITYSGIDDAVTKDGSELIYESTIFDADIILPDMVKTGYTFDGWYIGSSYDGTKIDVISGDLLDLGYITIYAYFSLKYSTITYGDVDCVIDFTDGDGNLLETQVLNMDNMYLTYPDVPAKEGYVFSGWKVQTTYGHYLVNLANQLIDNYTLTANWDDEKYLYIPTVYSNEYIYAERYYEGNPYKVDISKEATVDNPMRVQFTPGAPTGSFYLNVKSSVDIQILVYDENYNLVLLEPVKVSQSNEYTRYLISTHNFTSLYIYGAQDNGECEIYFENLTHYDTPTGTKESVQLEVYYGYTLNAHVVEKEQYEFIGYFSEPNGKGKQLTDNEGYPIGGRWLFEEDTTIYAYYVLIAVTAEETIVEYRKDWEINYTQNIPGNIEIKYYDQEGNEVVPFEIGEYKVIINYESEEYGSSSVESILKIVGPTPSEDFTIYGRNDVDNEYRYAYYHGNDKLVFADSEITRYGLNMNVTLLDYALFSGHSELEEIVIGKGINKIDYWCFYETSLNKVYYEGNIEEWNDIVIMSDGNELLESATIYFYSKEEPTSAGNYWHYVDGNPVAWN